MKKSICLLLFSLLCVQGYAQLDSGIIHTTITTKRADGVILATTDLDTWYKYNQLKIITRTEMSQSAIYIDRVKRQITNITEIMGKKLGFYMSTDNPGQKESDSVHIAYEDTTRYINGFRCNKATITYPAGREQLSDIIVWYCPDYKFKDSTMGVSIPGVERLRGFPILFDAVVPQGMMVTYVVDNINVSTPITDEEFRIPGGYEITSQEEYGKKLRELVSGTKE
ncbi:MAG TPA: hypothetical protein VM802_23090 [Chitinophaga sp.]|uniref:hypothetical protein n=1 Tax=Chitinophaga sp. TaxID=1869181 RepID=UPI002D0605C9|nr:hypothetical protein [Chitinophaga sp.]HVI47776.1 hypothetical protein [Chitinophaga sp.]